MWPEGILRPQTSRMQVYHAPPSTATTNSWQTWTKPLGCSFVLFFMQAAGGGGGRTQTGAQTTAAGGGGSGGWSRLLIPAMFLPDTIYLKPGNGGAGATTVNTAGGNGTASYISLTPDVATYLGMIIMTQSGGSGGAASTTAGAAGAAGSATTGFLQGVGLWQSVAGQIGTPGATLAGTVGTTQTSTTGTGFTITTGGAGGGNGSGAGGGITGSGAWPTLSGGTGTTGGAGSVGAGFDRPIDLLLNRSYETNFVFSGGTGGGGHTTGTAGNGGNASYGGGGGGGGAASGAGVSGNGGNGGDGFIIVMWW